MLRRHLAPAGVVGVFGDEPTPDRTATTQRALLDNVRRHGYQVVEVVRRRAGTTTVVGVLATD